jgi:hypothetical protein
VPLNSWLHHARRMAICHREYDMTGRRTGALMRIAGQVLFGTWAAALTLLFVLLQAPNVVPDLVQKYPRLAFLSEWRKALKSQLSAEFKQ